MSASSQDFDLTDLEKGLFELFKHVFVTNCHLDGASVTDEELKTLQELDALEVLENFKDVALNLLKFKEKYVHSEKAELTQQTEKFESMLRKLESEVRNHIRVEHQLRLHLETVQSKLDEAEADKAKSEQALSQLKAQLDHAHFSHSQPPKQKPETVKGRAREAYEGKLAQLLEQKNARIATVEEENLNLKNQLEEKNREIDSLRVSRTRGVNKHRARATIASIKRAIGDKSYDLSQLRQKLSQPKKVPLEKYVRPQSRQHTRSYSEYTKKRAPSR